MRGSPSQHAPHRRCTMPQTTDQQLQRKPDPRTDRPELENVKGGGFKKSLSQNCKRTKKLTDDAMQQYTGRTPVGQHEANSAATGVSKKHKNKQKETMF